MATTVGLVVTPVVGAVDDVDVDAMMSTTMGVSNRTGGWESADAASELLSNLIPALLQTFLVILCGYVMGATNLYPKQHAGAIGRLCGTLLLPVAMFDSMATLVVTEEAWTFLYAVLICKGSIFVIVLGVLLLVERSPGFIGRAAIWAVFSTQSNDFALGLPIFQVLYQAAQPGYLYFLYIVAPVNLVVLNPIAFILMAFSRSREQGKKFECKVIGFVLKQVFTNPLVLLTFIGVIFRLAAQQPASEFEWYSGWISPILQTVSKAFTGCALFSLGLLIVGKFKLLKKESPLKAILFILVKSLILPVALKLTIDMLSPGNPALSTAGFLYGIIPTASGVFTYCIQFGLQPDLIAVAMVLGTVASAPLMLGMGAMVAVATDPNFTIASIQPVVPYFKLIASFLTVAGALLFIIATAKKWKRLSDEVRMFQTCMLVAATALVIGNITVFPCQVAYADLASNRTSPELLTVGARTMYAISFFCTTFYRAVLAGLGLITVLTLRYFVVSSREPPLQVQRVYCAAVIGGAAAFSIIATATLLLVNSDDSCVTIFSEEASVVAAVTLLIIVAVLIVGLVGYNRLKFLLKTKLEGAQRVIALTEIAVVADDAAAEGSTANSSDSGTELGKPSQPNQRAADDDSSSDDIETAGEKAVSNREIEPTFSRRRTSSVSSDASSRERSDSMVSLPEEEVPRHQKAHTRYLAARLYTRRYSVFVYEACTSTLGVIALIISAVESDALGDDIIFFAITLILSTLTYSSGIVLCIALGFKMLSCRMPKASSKLINPFLRRPTASMKVGLAMDF